MTPGRRSRRPSPPETCRLASRGRSVLIGRWPRSSPPKQQQPDAFTLQICGLGGFSLGLPAGQDDQMEPPPQPTGKPTSGFLAPQAPRKVIWHILSARPRSADSGAVECEHYQTGSTDQPAIAVTPVFPAPAYPTKRASSADYGILGRDANRIGRQRSQ